MLTYVPPTGTIQMMTGVFLNPKQEDTLYFASTHNRDVFFDNYVYASYDEQTYSRPTRESVKIQDKADRLYKCSYMRFKNPSAFGSQWLYAFVLNVEYINNNTCEVFYVIDDMITWFPQCQLKECFIEREIPETDNLFENLVPENLETGDYTAISETSYDLNDSALVILSAKQPVPTAEFSFNFEYPRYNNYKEGLINDVFCPLWVRSFDVNDADDMWFFYRVLRVFVDDGQAENIVNIQYVPKFCLQNMKNTGSSSDDVHYATDEKKIRMTMAMGDIYDRYRPKNKKLFAYPYSCLLVSNQQGQVKQFKWEDFTETEIVVGNPAVNFKIVGTFFANPAVNVIPQGYKGIIGSNYDYAVTLTNFPPAPWICDTFKAYLAQNKASIATSILSDTLGALAGGYFGATSGSLLAQQGAELAAGKNGSMAGRYMEARGTLNQYSSIANNGLSAASSIANTLAKIGNASALPNKVANLTQNDAFNLIVHNNEVTFIETSIEGQMARTIDNYFSMFGYAIHRIKVPNTHSRPHWNYTKTQGCVVTGSAPASALSNIATIFDRGIRFWKNMPSIGNYELDNSPA